MEFGIFQALARFWVCFAIAAVSWLGSLSARFIDQQTFWLKVRISVEFKRAHYVRH